MSEVDSQEPPSKKSKVEDAAPEIESLEMGVRGSFDWNKLLEHGGADPAPVSAFKFAPMQESWDNFTMGMKVELPNTLCDVPGAYWIATVMRIGGYKALMRYEGFEADSTHDFWVNLCCKSVHAVGWCATVRRPLVPPRAIQSKEKDWKEYLVKKLTGSKTLPAEFHAKVMERVWDCPIKEGMHVEVVNKFLISTMRPAVVTGVYGRRLCLRYDAHGKMAASADPDFYCHQSSPIVHPVGWSQVVGHKIQSSNEYKVTSAQKAEKFSYSATDASPNLFPKVSDATSAGAVGVKEGQKLEAQNPLNLNQICPATVMKVLRGGYVMIGIDHSQVKDGSDHFCYHISSPYVMPIGTCEKGGIPLTAPKTKGKFSWSEYLKQTNAEAVPTNALKNEEIRHSFKVGMKLEAVDLMDPKLVCVGTVNEVCGRLLRIHFDGWDATYDQWVDCESPDIYPVGWCELVDYHLEGPKLPEPTASKKAKGAVGKKKGKKSMTSPVGPKPTQAVPAVDAASVEPKAESKPVATVAPMQQTSTAKAGTSHQVDTQPKEDPSNEASAPAVLKTTTAEASEIKEQSEETSTRQTDTEIAAVDNCEEKKSHEDNESEGKNSPATETSS